MYILFYTKFIFIAYLKFTDYYLKILDIQLLFCCRSRIIFTINELFKNLFSNMWQLPRFKRASGEKWQISEPPHQQMSCFLFVFSRVTLPAPSSLIRRGPWLYFSSRSVPENLSTSPSTTKKPQVGKVEFSNKPDQPRLDLLIQVQFTWTSDPSQV